MGILFLKWPFPPKISNTLILNILTFTNRGCNHYNSFIFGGCINTIFQNYIPFLRKKTYMCTPTMLIVKALKSIPTIQDNMDLDNMFQYEQNGIMPFKLAHNKF